MVTATAPTRPSTFPPTSVETYTFSFDVPAQRMKMRLGDDKWLLSELYGKWEILKADKNLRLHVRCKFSIDFDGKGYVWLPKDADVEGYAADVPEDAHDTCWRLCANKPDTIKHQEAYWRLRDERTGVMYSNEIHDYKGIQSVHYKPDPSLALKAGRPEHEPIQTCNCPGCDSFRHIYHTGPAIIDKDAGVAHFAL